ncbi:MAG: hypothetical protein LDL13_00500 [Calditerrivibrio sp.]|nr:hypothetical protein [Calditerrivibrio sp.]
MVVDNGEIKDDLERFENLIKMINFDYERFFAKILKHPPIVYEREVNKLIAKYNLNTITNPTLRFKFNNLVARYLTFRDKWNKRMMEFEGIKKTPFIKIAESDLNKEDKTKNKIDFESELDKLPPNIDRNKISKLIENKIEEYRTKGVENLEVKISIVENKPKLIIRPIK